MAKDLGYDELYALAQAAQSGLSDEMADFSKAAHPAALIALIDEVRRLRQAETIMNLDRVALQENAQHDRARIRTLTADYERLTAENERMRKALRDAIAYMEEQ